MMCLSNLAVIVSDASGAGTSASMHTVLLAATVGLLVSISMTLVRALKGPTSYDRILSVNAMGTAIVVGVSLLGFLKGRPDFLDLAVVYALVNFVATIAILRFVEYRSLG
ncbi:MAG: multicomponent Na+:H+ antiporter subunit F [Gammaproteobacteria bacterium]|jgi:multicomponent Na+:H+ antiporter subunit F